MKSAVVVIPVYKPELNEFEEASFRHNADVLKNHDTVVVHPEGLDLTIYKSLAPNVVFKAFAPKYFNGIRGYNRMMIAPWFYRAFSEYEYMLICHHDAWIFKDELIEWCSKGYDNVAAPFLKPFPPGKTSTLLPFLSGICVNKIGNGGLSLRKTKTFLKAARRLRFFSLFYFYNEDVFWALFPSFVTAFKCPSVSEANRFSARMLYPGGVLGQDGNLPFGCHGWFRPDEIEFWSRYVKTDKL